MADRRLTGRFTYPGLGAGAETFRLNAYGSGPSDRRTVAAHVLGLRVGHVPASARSGLDPEDRTVAVAEVAVARKRLHRGKLASIRDLHAEGATFDAPILVAETRDGLVALDGAHRLAVHALEGAREVVVKVIPRRPAKLTKDGDGAPTMSTAADPGLTTPKPAGAETTPKPGASVDRLTAHPSKAARRMLRIAEQMGDAEDAAVLRAAMMVRTQVRRLARLKRAPDDEIAALRALRDAVVREMKSRGLETLSLPSIRAARKSDSSPADANEETTVELLHKRAMGMTDTEMRAAVQKAVKAKHGYAYSVAEMFPESQTVVCRCWSGECGGPETFCRMTYDCSEDGTCTLGDAETVQLDYTPIEDTEEVDEEMAMSATPQLNGGHVVKGLGANAEAFAKSMRDLQQVISAEAAGEDVCVRFCDPATAGKEVRIRGIATYEQPADSEAAPAGDLTRAEQEQLTKACARAIVLRSADCDDDERLRKAEQKGIVTLCVYQPGEDQSDAQGEYATEDDLEEAAHFWFQRSRRIKVEHGVESPADRSVESWIQPADWKIGKRLIKAGSWMIRVHLSKASLEKFNRGEFTGASMGGTRELAPARA